MAEIPAYTAVFKAPSFTDMIAPFVMYQLQYNTLADAFSQLEQSAAKWEKLANSAIDKDLYEIYKGYADNLKAAANRIAAYGIDPLSAFDLRAYRRMYNELILPIDEAWELRNQRVKEWRELYQKDNSIRFQRNPGNIGLSEYISNPNTDWGESVSGDAIEKETATLAKLAVLDAISTGKLESLGVPYLYRQKIIKEGLPAEEVLNYLVTKNPTIGQQLLKKITDLVKKSYSNITSPELQAYIDENIEKGLWAAVGKAEYSEIKDTFGMEMAKAAQDHQYRMAEMEYKDMLDHPEKYGIGNTNADPSVTDVLTPVNLYEQNPEFKGNNKADFIKSYLENHMPGAWDNSAGQQFFVDNVYTKGGKGYISKNAMPYYKTMVDMIISVYENYQDKKAGKSFKTDKRRRMTNRILTSVFSGGYGSKEIKDFIDEVFKDTDEYGVPNVSEAEKGKYKFVFDSLLTMARKNGYDTMNQKERKAFWRRAQNVFSDANNKINSHAAFNVMYGDIVSQPEYRVGVGEGVNKYNSDTKVTSGFTLGELPSELRTKLAEKMFDKNTSYLKLTKDGPSTRLLSDEISLDSESADDRRKVNPQRLVYYNGDAYVETIIGDKTYYIKLAQENTVHTEIYGAVKKTIDSAIKTLENPNATEQQIYQARVDIAAARKKLEQTMLDEFALYRMDPEDEKIHASRQ